MRNDVNTAPQPPGLSATKQALLAKWLRAGPAKNPNAAADIIPRRNCCGPIPLSLEQQRLWFFQQLEPQSALYTMPIASRLRGELNSKALQQAIDLVVTRHEALRTRIVGQVPTQVIDAPAPAPLLSIDLRSLPATQREAEAKRLLETEAKRPFDLSRDLMVRSVLIRVGEQDWIFLVLMHHVASDDWSWRVFCGEVGTIYEAIISGRKPELPEPAIQYSDFAVWQQEFWRGDILEKHLAYWRKQLEGAPPVLELPADRPRPASQTFRGACEWLTLPPALSEKLNTLGQSGGFTPFMILLAAFQTLLRRYTGQEDIVVGSPVAGRTRASLEKVIGVFVNMLVLRTKLEGNPAFSELLRRTQTTVLESLAQQDLPFEKFVQDLKPERSASYSPLVQVMFALQDELSDNLNLPGIDTSAFPLDTCTAKFDLTFTVVKSSSRLDCCAEYNSDLFDAATARRMLGHYERLLEAIADNPEQPLSDLPLLNDSEREQLFVEWNRSEADFPREKCVHELVAAQTAATPDSIAVVCGTESLTYRELNHRANQLAHYLVRLGIGTDSLVAISMERTLEMMVALLGILKAGGAYVPLDPSYPIERLRFMLEDCKASLLLRQSNSKKQFDGLPSNVRAICLDADWPQISQQPHGEPPSQITSDNLVYVIYTSGSTGQPKGVQIPHRAVVNLLQAMKREPGLTSGDTLLSVTSISFDIAALELFLPLIVGARVVLATADEIYDAAKTKALLRDSGATVMQATPSFWLFLVDAGWPGDKRLKILCGGEALSRSLANKLLERGGEAWNLYGPTETTIWSTAAKIAAGNEPITIGWPIANTQVYVLDAHLQPVPVGVPGELYIGGEGLALGYLNRPELTADRFIPNPFARESSADFQSAVSQVYNLPGARLYKTGDIVRYRPDGAIECLGRNDSQIKLRGHRIDLGEIESALRQHRDVRDAVVSLNQDAAGQKQLIAYLLTASGTSPQSAELQPFLKLMLPDYMVPATFVALDNFPLTPNGKVNRKALPAPSHGDGRAVQSFTPPGTITEQTLAQIWENLLQLSRLGIHDNFFEIGGHSLLAMQFIARVGDTFQAELSLRQVFEAPTIAELAAVLDKKQKQPAAQIAPPVPRAQRISPEHAKDLLGKLDQLSDTEVESLLQQISPGP
jgi:amino acid adenylation domain-containing protein